MISLHGNETFFEIYILLYLEIGSFIHPNHLTSLWFLKDKSILM